MFRHGSHFNGMRQTRFLQELSPARRGRSQDEAKRCGHVEFMMVGAAFDKP